jgi:tRNA 2-thiouridine synthesizing protein A
MTAMGDFSNPEALKTIDARHLACPLPVLKARKALLQMVTGDLLQVLATDPAARRDFPDFAEASGNQLLEVTELPDGVLRFMLKRG